MDSWNEEDFDTEEWKPPTEAERKIQEARRERSDQISKLMGSYLLKGHKMLATTCPVCQTILMRNKEGTDYCVACTELATDTSKDDPALSLQAAERQVAEQRQRVEDLGSDENESVFARAQATSAIQNPINVPSLEEPALQPKASGDHGAKARVTFELGSASSRDVDHTIEAVEQKMHWADEQLRKTEITQQSIELVQLIRECSQTLMSLINLKQKVV